MEENILGHYRLIEKVGAGGMGVVYRARDERLERDVAVKVLPHGALADEDSRKRFRAEAMALSKLNHPNIAVIHDFDSKGGIDFLAMEFISGRTLAETADSGAMTEAEVVRVGKQVAEALEAAHEQGLVHRDLKPGNIMMTSRGLVKVLDFGLAKLFRTAGPSGATLTQTAPQSLRGTLPYMAPEQLEDGAVDARTDIFALGAILFELATGKRPFPQDSPSQIMRAILQGQPDLSAADGAGISDALKRVILKCLANSPSERYASARDLIRDLDALQDGRPLGPSAPGSRPAGRRTALRPALISAAAVIILTGLALAFNLGGLRNFLRRGGVPNVRSLAVLPLESLSPGSEQDYLAEGMTDSLINALGQVSTLRVTSRTSVSRYQKTEKSLPEVAEELKVDLIVEGSVQSSGENVRITAHLIRPAEERRLWSKSYERRLGDFLILQNEIAADITTHIGVRLSEEASLQTTKHGALNPRAVEAYLKGVSTNDIGHFLQAVKIEPDFAPAYAKIASGYFYSGLFGSMPAREAFLRMKEAALRALEKDPSLGEAHGYLAVASLHHDLDWQKAEREFKRAFALNPSLADLHHLYAHYLMAKGRIDESMEEVNLAEALDPFSWDQSQCFGWHCFYTKDYDLALELALDGVRADPKNAWAHVILGWAYEQKNMLPEAISEFREAVAAWKDDPLPLAGLGHALGLAGRTGESRAVLNRLLDMSKEKFVPAYDVAVVLMGLGEKDRALEWLTKACEERSGFIVYIKCDRRFDGLKSDPRFDALLKRIGLPA